MDVQDFKNKIVQSGCFAGLESMSAVAKNIANSFTEGYHYRTLPVLIIMG